MTVVVFLDHFCPNPSTSTVKTSGPQSPGPSTPLVDTEETPEKIEGNHDAFKPAAVEDIQLEYSSN